MYTNHVTGLGTSSMEKECEITNSGKPMTRGKFLDTQGTLRGMCLTLQ